MKFNLASNWQNKDRTCAFCGGKISVKYDVTENQDNKDTTLPCCNTCIVSILFADEDKRK